LAACPKCGSRKIAPARVFEAVAEPSSGTPRPPPIKVSIGQCEKCGAEFPTIESRRKYLLAPAVELEKVRKVMERLKSDNEAMNFKINDIVAKEEELRSSIEKVRREGEVSILERRCEVLTENVSYLRSEKERLERLASVLSLAAPLVSSANRYRNKA
jgi:predicted RNase H-like nuclease (RuvC/YqgF family)